MTAHGKVVMGSIAFKALTPLLDTLFILLCSLLALTDTRTARPAEVVRVKLPQVEPLAGASGLERRQLVIEIGRDSRVRLGADGHEVRSRAELDQALSAALGDALPEEVIVELQADRDVRHGVAVDLLQHLRLLGFTNVHLLATGSRDESEAFGGR